MSASFVGCDKILATLSFTLGMAAMGFCYPSIRVNALDLSSNYSATIMAVVNGLGCLSGMATPYVVGILTPNVSNFVHTFTSKLYFCKCKSFVKLLKNFNYSAEYKIRDKKKFKSYKINFII